MKIVDNAGNRIRSNVNGSVTNYLVDESFVYPQVVSEYDDLGTVTTEYHRGLGLISMNNGISEYNYHYDALGSVRALSDESGVTDTYDYDAYGELKTHIGTTENSYLYTGEQYDDETGNYYLRARYYNPSAGQFISRDSWEGDDRNPITLNKYAYANSNPAMFTDPTGHFSMMEFNAYAGIQDVLSKISIPLNPDIPSQSEILNDGAKIFQKKLFLLEPFAAWNVLFYSLEDSYKSHREYGGWIIKHGFIFYATEPAIGERGTVMGAGVTPPVPELKKGEITAGYHTHYNPYLHTISVEDVETFNDKKELPGNKIINQYIGNVCGCGTMWAWYAEDNKNEDYKGVATSFILPCLVDNECRRMW